MLERIMAATHVLYTIGHSNRPLEEFIGLLRAHGVERLIDVRNFPMSRHNPQFNRETLSKSLRNRRIGYRHLKALGGRRRPQPDSANTGWRNTSFRGYADYMQTHEFTAALEHLIALAKEKSTAIMCAEAVPWRCHRSLIADAMTVRGWEIRDIMTPKSAPVHKLPAMARVKGKQLVYVAE
jgi:uncharacterized protein (DUF488 family)